MKAVKTKKPTTDIEISDLIPQAPKAVRVQSSDRTAETVTTPTVEDYIKADTAEQPAEEQDPEEYELGNILNVPFSDSDVPTLVSYFDKSDKLPRYVLLCIPQTAVAKGWHWYQDHHPNARPDNYLNELYAVTGITKQRQYGAVCKLHLE